MNGIIFKILPDKKLDFAAETRSGSKSSKISLHSKMILRRIWDNFLFFTCSTLSTKGDLCSESL